MLDSLRREPGLFAEVYSIPAAAALVMPRRHLDGSGAPEDPARQQVDALCSMARNLGADYLFLFGGTIDRSTVRNGASVLNLTIVGAFFVPSREVQGEGKATGALVDLKTRRIVYLVSAATEQKRFAAAVTEEAAQLDLAHSVRDKLTAELSSELIKRLGSGRGVAVR
jgi:hypothetical protein